MSKLHEPPYKATTQLAHGSHDTTTATAPRLAGEAARYRIDTPIGRGGMARVYRAVDTATGGVVALKCLLDVTAAKRTLVMLFEREYYTLAQLEHPHIVRAYDYVGPGKEEDPRAVPFYTMELLDGADVGEFGPLEWRAACRILLDLASALSLIHSRRLVHRDVSTNNVRFTSDGKVKLIDFGALVPFGRTAKLLGTPPFVAPEALHHQELDQRTDLYALGALGYWLISGRHAYDPQRLTDLQRLWQHPPVPLTKQANVPKGVADVIASLLSLDRLARPTHAAEVMDRLSALAGLQTPAHANVQNAYLSTPQLVGRKRELSQLTVALGKLGEGRGSAWLISGEPGSGRTRLLNELALEAKLQGALVLRATPGPADCELSLIRSLIDELYDADPSAKERAPTKVAWLDQAASRTSACPEADPRQRREASHRALHDWLLAEARKRPLVLLIDDLDRADDASVRLVAALARTIFATRDAGPSNMLVAMTQGNSPRGHSVADQVLAKAASEVRLGPLELEHVEALLVSIFGHQPQIAPVAQRIQMHAHGNPQAVLQLAQELVHQGLAHYERGRWALPGQHQLARLGASLGAAFVERVGALGDDARELAQALALCVDEPLGPEDFAALTAHGSARRCFDATDALMLHHVLKAERGRLRFAHPGWVAALREELEPAARAGLHRRIADVLEAKGVDRLRVVRHRLEGDQPSEAIDLLLCEIEQGSRWESGPADYGDVLKRAFDRAERLGRPTSERYTLAKELVTLGRNLGVGELHPYVKWLMSQLQRASGLADWEVLCSEDGPTRLHQALQRAQERHEGATEHERLMPPREAVEELATLIALSAGIAYTIGDASLGKSLPSLAPFTTLSPTIEIFEQLRILLTTPAGTDSVAFLEGYREILAKLERQNLGAERRELEALRLGVIYGLGITEAVYGIGDPPGCADTLAEHGGWRVAAWQVRRQHHLSHGRLAEARRCEDEIASLHLATGSRGAFQGGGVHIDVVRLMNASDLSALRACTRELTEASLVHPAVLPWKHLADACYEQLRGHLQAAQSAIELALDSVGVDVTHRAWAYIAAQHISILSDAGDPAEAVRVGSEYLHHVQQPKRVAARNVIATTLALAEAQLGRPGPGIAALDVAVQDAQARGYSGLQAGSLYEARARVALARRDRAGFERDVQLCRQHWAVEGWPALAAKYKRLVEAGRLISVADEARPRPPVADDVETEFEP